MRLLVPKKFFKRFAVMLHAFSVFLLEVRIPLLRGCFVAFPLLVDDDHLESWRAFLFFLFSVLHGTPPFLCFGSAHNYIPLPPKNQKNPVYKIPG